MPVPPEKRYYYYPIRCSDGEAYRTDGLYKLQPLSAHEESEKDIISCEPLAPEGTAEWAWQMMLLGKKICHRKAPSIYYHKPTHYVKRVVRENCTDDMSADVWHNGADTTGWQLYEPEPAKEPDYVICKRCAGSQSVPNPAVSNTAYTTCSKCGGTGYEIDEQKKRA